MSTFWIVIIVICSFTFLNVLFYFAMNLLFYNLSLARNSIMRKFLQKHLQKNYVEYGIDFKWFEDKPVEVFKEKSRDSKQLVANFYEQNDGDRLAILCHGYGADFRELSKYVKYFYDKGFSVLIPEFRAHGNSEGERIGMGWPDRLDLKKWIGFMVKRNPKYKIVLFGLSMGASTVCMTVGEELPDNVKCAISDCAYDNVYGQFEYVSRRLKIISPKIIMKIYNNFLKKAFDINLLQFDAIRQVKKAKIPMLFIHGENDEFVPFENLKRLYDAHPIEGHKYLYACKGAEHAKSYLTDEKEYERQLDEFIKVEYK